MRVYLFLTVQKHTRDKVKSAKTRIIILITQLGFNLKILFHFSNVFYFVTSSIFCCCCCLLLKYVWSTVTCYCGGCGGTVPLLVVEEGGRFSCGSQKQVGLVLVSYVDLK